MRRLLVLLVLIGAGVAAVATASAGSDDPSRPSYTIELDNAFGLTEGADVKVAGVRAGRVSGMRVDRRTKRALIDITIDSSGFGSLRTDAFCETRPQSLIGEYYVDCRPGTAAQRLKPGATLPVAQTASTIPLDLINNIMRRPYRERLAIILDELGAGVGGRSSDIREALARAVPALRETDQVLAILADQNTTLANLTRDADAVIGDLAANRTNVGRFVTETKQTAAASAERRQQIAESLQRLPAFLRELEPTMAKLGAATDAQTPALADLNQSAGQLATLLENLPEFADASRTGFKSLAELSRDGRPALRSARPTVDLLNQFSTNTPELANNLAIVLTDLGDRDRAVERDPRSPGGKGYTGMEALLQYVFDQTMAINAFDSNGYMLKVDLFLSECSDYQNLQSLKEKLKQDPQFYARCAAILGPHQPGITQPDPSFTGAQLVKEKSVAKSRDKTRAPDTQPKTPAAPPAASNGDAPSKKEIDKARRQAEKLHDQLEDTLGIDLPDLPATPALPPLPTVPSGAGSAGPDQLLDFLLAP
ncbi:MAG TPA: MlaD family protein [Solirubrobacteraceae bacterium]|nr:MlaD family protein [Solirubrobacteraceae bacterium]